MKVVVTGATGNVDTSTVQALSDDEMFQKKEDGAIKVVLKP